MKRWLLMALSTVFFVSFASAQLPRAQMESRLSGKVEKAAREASIKNLEEARSLLAISYLSGMLGAVDEVLTQYPELVNETIKGEDGESVPMVYHAFLPSKHPTNGQRKIMQQIEDVKVARKEADARVDEAGEGKAKASGKGYLAELEADHQYWEEYRQLRILDRKLEDLGKALTAQQYNDAAQGNPMLAIFYKHGATCEKCLQESFTKHYLREKHTGFEVESGNPNAVAWWKVPVETPSQTLTLLYNLPVYGASVTDIMKLHDPAKWIPFAKQITVTKEELQKIASLIARAEKEYMEVQAKQYRELMKKILERAYSSDPKVRKEIAKYKRTYAK